MGESPHEGVQSPGGDYPPDEVPRVTPLREISALKKIIPHQFKGRHPLVRKDHIKHI